MMLKIRIQTILFFQAFSVPEEKFIFDFIYELVDWMKETLPNRQGIYLILKMRK